MLLGCRRARARRSGHGCRIRQADSRERTHLPLLPADKSTLKNSVLGRPQQAFVPRGLPFTPVHGADRWLWFEWLDPMTPLPALLETVREPHEGPFETRDVSTAVNHVGNDDPDVLLPVPANGLF